MSTLRRLDINLITWSLGLSKNFIGRNEHKFYKLYSRYVKCQDPMKITTRLAMPQDYDNIMKHMCSTYFNYEPALVNIGLAGCAVPSMIHFMRQHLKEGMTVIATRSDNCIIGAAINIGICPWDSERMIKFANCCESGRVKELIKFFAYVTKQPQLWEKYCVLKVFECSYLAVDEEYQGIGIAKKLIQESWNLAKDCGYQLFRIDCTSKYTAKIAEGFNWECVYRLPYKNYVDCGALVFKHVQEPHTEVAVYIDRLKFCK